MLMDHTGATVLRALLRLPAIANDPAQKALWTSIYSSFRDIGRLAFPIFCFLLVEGFLHTRNVWKYAGRLFLFALISEIPFDIALKGSWYFPAKQNVYFTLLIGLLVLIAICALTDHMTHRLFLAVLPIAAGMWLANWINTDYNYKGVLLIAILYLMKSSRLYQCLGGAAAVAWELPAPLAFVPIYLYNGTRGRQMKYLFYWFYPVHLMVLYVIANYLIPLL
jgi:hypothetical protein